MCLWEIYTCKDLFPHHSDYDEFMEAICVKGERPPIPKDCLPSLKALLEECWQKDPAKRPDFTEINQRLNNILVEAAISEHDAQSFWKEKFLSTKRLQVCKLTSCFIFLFLLLQMYILNDTNSLIQKTVKFDKEFAPAIYRFLGLGKVPRDDGSETKDPAVLNYRALRALAGKKNSPYLIPCEILIKFCILSSKGVSRRRRTGSRY